MVRPRKRFWVTFLVLAAFALGTWTGGKLERMRRAERTAPPENILEVRDLLRFLQARR